MPINMRLSSPSLLVLLALVAVDVSASNNHEHSDGRREHGAHVHGIAQLNLALEDSELHVELHSPAVNIVGFEHAPSSEADHAALDRAFTLLRDGARLFDFNRDAGCSVKDVKIASSLTEDEHDAHAHDTASDHAHEEREDENHADIEAAYNFECVKPAQLKQLTVELFEAFPDTERLKVQFVVGDQQGAAELTPTDHVVTF